MIDTITVSVIHCTIEGWRVFKPYSCPPYATHPIHHDVEWSVQDGRLVVTGGPDCSVPLTVVAKLIEWSGEP